MLYIMKRGSIVSDDDRDKLVLSRYVDKGITYKLSSPFMS